jgi:hypothetical protein
LGGGLLYGGAAAAALRLLLPCAVMFAAADLQNKRSLAIQSSLAHGLNVSRYQYQYKYL